MLEEPVLPNILIAGTPCTGKSTLAEMIAEQTGMNHINVGDVAKREGYLDSWDEKYQCHVLDEDLLIDGLEERMVAGYNVVEYHETDFFPERWFNLVLVLQTNNTVLYDRLKARGYSEFKLQENLDCEIMQIIAEQARESYVPEIVHCLQSDTVEDAEANCARTVEWLKMHMEARGAALPANFVG